MKRQIGKISVARSQLDTVIKLIFENDDSVSIATLLHPAWHILKDLLRHKAIESSRDWMAKDQLIKPQNNGLKEKDIWGILNKDWNFLKHASGDPDGVLDFDDDYLEGVTMFAINDFGQIADQSPNMNIYQLWFIAKNPDLFKDQSVCEASSSIFPDLHVKDVCEQKQLGLGILGKSEAEIELLLGDLHAE